MSAESDFFFVQLPNGQHKAMSLDELDAAYQAGSIDEATPVRPDGASDWSTLGALVGGDDVPDTTPSITPPPVSQSYATPVSGGRGSAEGGTRDAHEPPNSLAPVAIWSQAAFAPTLEAQPTSNLDLDLLDDNALKPPSKTKYIVTAIGAGAVVAVLALVGLTRGDAAKSLPEVATKAAAAAAPPAETKLPAPAPTNKLTDEQRKLLADQDKKREAADTKKRNDRAAAEAAKPQRRGARGKSNEPFVKGGSKYDPLNGAL